MASQHSDPELFERIVQEVIRRLVAGGVTVGATGNKQLALSERVITLATLDGKLDGVETVSVQKRAVVTPAVKDELNRRSIRLVLG
ncbi:MAG TPA: hypothetical protein DCY79_19290 [Planctomycetaceae bacterium]|nr:hypothetical protein [Blastopirellula sp.]HAY81953.1 hypothetical protein [Planctomycetaceae bacterium]|tara:strand:+ start:610 stop:867 length:258 start_codon:yes stop_codon:yes gene_type:complete